MAVQNEQARKFSTLMELLMPDPPMANDNLLCAFDDVEYDESFLNMYNEAAFTQADEWARYFWPAPS